MLCHYWHASCEGHLRETEHCYDKSCSIRSSTTSACFWAEPDGASPAADNSGGFRCEECNDLFSSRESLKKHAKSHQARECRFFCSYCPFSSDYAGNITRHEMTHRGERPFTCDLCGKAFGTKHHLVAHWRSHTGERPYECNACDKAFKTSSDLSRHKRTHAGDAPYVCRECGYAYARKEDLLAHCISHYRDGS